MANEKIAQQPLYANVPELSVSELAFSLKKTLEETYGRIRVRGELSRVTIAGSGHMYADIKDENALINTVCWKGTVNKLPLKPEEGLEVICTGKISTYPLRSNYQLIIESMELAGEGALLKMLEERKKKLAAEGLFASERKKKLPFIPKLIGVISSPTGAVIKDIMHRLNDRFPRHVLLYPVLVQGEGAAQQVSYAINAFNKLEGEQRPDLLIVARGGGSLEDLMPFNEEIVVRAAAASEIPLISAVGHETDTTLIDYASDVRAPTPTGAAEMAVPQRLDLLTKTAEKEQRLIGIIKRFIDNKNDYIQNISARLGDPKQLLDIKTQKLDHLSHKINSSFSQNLSSRRERIIRCGAKITHPKNLIQQKQKELSYFSERLLKQKHLLLKDRHTALNTHGRMLESLSFKSVLKRGFVVVHDEKGKAITSAGDTQKDQSIYLQFHDNERVDAVIGKKSAKKSKKLPSEDQGKLF